jgi:hypothetical protein
VIDGGAQPERSGRYLLRLRITAEADGIRREYMITYGRRGRNVAVGRAYAKTDAPGGRETNAGRFSALIKALTEREPRVHHMKSYKIIISATGNT